MLKRVYGGTFHKTSPKHLDRYVQEFGTRHNIRDADTIDEMMALAAAFAGERLRYQEPITDNGLDQGRDPRSPRLPELGGGGSGDIRSGRRRGALSRAAAPV